MDEIDHFIERHILETLMLVRSARFSQMRPLKVDSNLYSYHLSKLLKYKYVEKVDRDYSLAPKGLAYVDRISANGFRPRIQPKINSGILLKNVNGQVLLTKRSRQPLIGLWGLPMGKIHESDTTLLSAAERECYEKVGVRANHMRRIGGCYMRTYKDDILVSNSMSHIFMQDNFSEYIELNENTKWFDVDQLSGKNIIQGVDKIVKLACENEEFFVEINSVIE